MYKRWDKVNVSITEPPAGIKIKCGKMTYFHVIWNVCAHLWRWCCHRNAGEAGLPRTWRPGHRCAGGRRSPGLAVWTAPSWGLCWAGQPAGRRRARPAFAGARRWRRGGTLTPPAPLPARWDGGAAVETGDAPPAVCRGRRRLKSLRIWACRTQIRLLLNKRRRRVCYCGPEHRLNILKDGIKYSPTAHLLLPGEACFR